VGQRWAYLHGWRRAGPADHLAQDISDKEHGSAAAVKAGINHFLDTYKDDLTKALKDGLVTEADMDAALKNLLRVYLRSAKWTRRASIPTRRSASKTKGELPPWERGEAKRWRARRPMNRSCCSRMKTTRCHSIARKLKTIAVIGPWADQVLLDWYSGTPPYSVSILEGFAKPPARASRCSIPTVPIPPKPLPSPRRDVAIVVVGNHPECNAGWDQCPTPSNGKEDVDRKTIVLEQEELVKQVFAANPKQSKSCAPAFPTPLSGARSTCRHRPHDAQQPGRRPRPGRCFVWRLLARWPPHADLAYRRRPVAAHPRLQPARMARPISTAKRSRFMHLAMASATPLCKYERTAR
jgi:beta-glucosidase